MTTREQLQMNYWQIAEGTLVSLSDSIISDYVFGKKITDDCKVSLLHNLWFYLDILQQKKEDDIASGSFSGMDTYKSLFCTSKIIKQLRCTGIDSTIIQQLFNVYLQDITTTGGIGSMIIQGLVNPFHIRGTGQTGTGYNITSVPPFTTPGYPPYPVPLPTSGYDIMVVRLNVSADTIFTNLLPANCQFVNLTFDPQNTNIAQLSMGTTVGGVECFGSWGIGPKTSPVTTTTAVVMKSFSTTLPTTLYLHHASMGDDWGGAVYTLTFWFKKL